MNSLVEHYEQWCDWAKSHPQDVDGWQSQYPAWEALMEAAASVMTSGVLESQVLDAVEKCWVISEEDETLADYAKTDLSRCWPVICYLAGSESYKVRWQVYEVLGSAGRIGEPFLRRGLKDSDNYARRRALLALARHRPSDAEYLAATFLEDGDPYLRLAAIDMVRVSNDPGFVANAKSMLANDPEYFVREAVKTELCGEDSPH